MIPFEFEAVVNKRIFKIQFDAMDIKAYNFRTLKFNTDEKDEDVLGMPVDIVTYREDLSPLFTERFSKDVIMYDTEIPADLLNKTLDCLNKIQTKAESNISKPVW